MTTASENAWAPVESLRRKELGYGSANDTSGRERFAYTEVPLATSTFQVRLSALVGSQLLSWRDKRSVTPVARVACAGEAHSGRGDLPA